jgi:hypothetical protein
MNVYRGPANVSGADAPRVFLPTLRELAEDALHRQAEEISGFYPGDGAWSSSRTNCPKSARSRSGRCAPLRSGGTLAEPTRGCPRPLGRGLG